MKTTKAIKITKREILKSYPSPEGLVTTALSAELSFAGMPTFGMVCVAHHRPDLRLFSATADDDNDTTVMLMVRVVNNEIEASDMDVDAFEREDLMDDANWLPLVGNVDRLIEASRQRQRERIEIRQRRVKELRQEEEDQADWDASMMTPEEVSKKAWAEYAHR